MRTQSPPLQHKRPRGLWRGRRGAAGPTCAEPKLGTRSHDPYSDPADSSASASASSISSDAFEDDFDDDHSSDSSCKRRRLSGALSDSDTLWHQSPSSRALTPDLLYHAPCFPSQILNPPPYPATSPYPYIMFPVADKFSSINTKAKGKQSSVTDLEDWENLKELFNRANESYECASLVICSTVHTRLLGDFAPLFTRDLGVGCGTMSRSRLVRCVASFCCVSGGIYRPTMRPGLHYQSRSFAATHDVGRPPTRSKLPSSHTSLLPATGGLCSPDGPMDAPCVICPSSVDLLTSEGGRRSQAAVGMPSRPVSARLMSCQEQPVARSWGCGRRASNSDRRVGPREPCVHEMHLFILVSRGVTVRYLALHGSEILIFFLDLPSLGPDECHRVKLTTAFTTAFVIDVKYLSFSAHRRRSRLLTIIPL